MIVQTCQMAAEMINGVDALGETNCSNYIIFSCIFKVCTIIKSAITDPNVAPLYLTVCSMETAKAWLVFVEGDLLYSFHIASVNSLHRTSPVAFLASQSQFLGLTAGETRPKKHR